MRLEGKQRFFLRRSLTSALALFLVLPVIISVLIHLGFLVYASRVQWHLGYAGKDKIPKSILINIKKEQKPLALNEEPRKVKEELFKPREKKKPKLRYRPAMPKPDPHPGGAGGKKEGFNILTAAGAGTNSGWFKVDIAQGSGGGMGKGTGSGSRPLHAAAEQPGQTFAEYIQALREKGLDVVIVFDSTYSMTPVMEEIKRKIGNLALVMRRLVPSCRIGLVAYRDAEEEYVTKVHPLSYGISSLQQFLLSIRERGGGDLPEAVDAGLAAAIDKMKWNKRSKALILLIGDAPPHKKDIPLCIGFARTFKKDMQGTLSALDVRTPSNITREQWERDYRPKITDMELESFDYMTDSEHVMDAFQKIAQAGGGESARLINEEKVVKHMLLYIFGSRWEAYLTEFMKNL